jgi:hypothetical protein
MGVRRAATVSTTREVEVDQQTLQREAHRCRLQAHCYVGRSEALVLLKVAEQFERLAKRSSGCSEPKG